jgi:hypothetical protein
MHTIFNTHLLTKTPSSRLPHFSAIQLADVKNGTSSVVSIRETETALTAFKKLMDFDISGAVIVDASGAAIDVLSLRDFYALGKGAIAFRLVLAMVKISNNAIIARSESVTNIHINTNPHITTNK